MVIEIQQNDTNFTILPADKGNTMIVLKKNVQAYNEKLATEN